MPSISPIREISTTSVDRASATQKPVRMLFAIVTAFAFFLMSVDCACGRALLSRGGTSPIADSEAEHCCAHQNDAPEHHDGGDEDHGRPVPHHGHSNPCDGSCDHCGQTVIN